jgi:hypothetical protein
MPVKLELVTRTLADVADKLRRVPKDLSEAERKELLGIFEEVATAIMGRLKVQVTVTRVLAEATPPAAFEAPAA